jgi:O-antigen ligase
MEELIIRDIEDRSRFGEILGKLIVIGLFLLMVFSVLVFGTVDPWSIAIFNVAIVVLLFLWAIRCVVERRLQISLPATALPLALLFIYGILQGITLKDQTGKVSSLSMDVEATWLAVEMLGALLIAFLIAATCLNGQDRLIWIKYFLICFGFALALFGLIQHFAWNGKFYWFVNSTVPVSSPFGPFVNHNHFAGYLEMIVPIPFALILTRAVRSELSLIYGFVGIIMSIAVIVSLSRSGMISLICGLVFVFLFSLRSKILRDDSSSSITLFLSRMVAAAVLIVTIGAGIWWVGGDSVIKRVEMTDLSTEVANTNTGNKTFYQSRGWIWRDTAAMIRDKWATGVGLGAYQTAYPIYSRQDGSLIVGQAHNDYLQVLADGGLVGAVLALLFIILLFVDIVRATAHRNRVMAGLALGCGGGIFAMLVHSLFDFNLQIPSNALLFLVLTAVVYIIGRSAMNDRVSESMFKLGFRHQGASREMEVIP